ncbi:zinc finger CCCH domain-containing protein 10-like [Lycorma delicatula]|uniref:zinc finger CCCH domain-containing protein 10-like n=1 Tax=Lycorma delicatula TaxID=130591 RepID=UPI003F51567B
MGNGSEYSFDDRKEDGKNRGAGGDYDKRKRDEKRRGMVCRDFLRNLCKRGSACKFQHPETRKKLYSFCHDFQNGECRRNKYCRFIHSSHEDELHYERTGKLPSHLIDWYQKSRSMSPEESGVPICKQYLWSECKRGNCRYKHVSMSEYRKIQRRSTSPLKNDNVKMCGRQDLHYNENNKLRDDYYEPELKRSRPSYIDENDARESRVDTPVTLYENANHYSSRPQPERTYMMLEEENMMLRERVSELKKRVDDLQVTNEFLLEQNAQLRLRDKNATGLTTVTVPAVTITNTVPGANQIQQAPTPQQMVNAAIRTVTASVATVPVSLAAVTPVSLAAVSMAPVQQMPPPVVTMAQQAAPPPTDPQVPRPLPMSMSAPSAPLVSYPIMSRTVMQPPPDMRH